jgi:ABC-type branched-subunit amino acid transport system substrate-binding protein
MLSPIERQRRNFLILLIIPAALIVVGVAAFATLSLYTASKPNPAPPPTSIGVTTVAGGEHIGISDGSYAFDTNRIDGDLKHQAADKFKSGDITSAESLWKRALAQDTNDAETLIYQEDQRVLDSHNPYITLVVGTMLTGTDSAVSTGRDNLQGAYVAQKEYNDGFKLHGGVQVRLLVASSGSQAEYATSVAQQIVQAAKQDAHIVGVMGWPFSSRALKAVGVLSNAHIPMLSPTASSDELTNRSPFFFRVAPSNNSEAIAGAQYVEQQLHAKRVVLFVDPNDAYSNSLANDFSKRFTADGNQIVVTENYTVGKPETLPSLLQDALTANPDLIYFSGYADDMGVLLTDLPASQPRLQVLGGDALYELGGYPPSARVDFSRIHMTAFAYPDEWSIEKLQQPTFFTNYAQNFGPVPAGKSPYGYTRPDNDVILSYDALFALLQGCNNALSSGKTSLTPDELQQGLASINGPQAIQGISGQISFASNGDPTNKAIVILYVDPTGHIRLQESNGIQGCFLVGKCSNL